MSELHKYVRQYRHNNSDEFVKAYDEAIDVYVCDLLKTIQEQRELLKESEPLLNDYMKTCEVFIKHFRGIDSINLDEYYKSKQEAKELLSKLKEYTFGVSQ